MQSTLEPTATPVSSPRSRRPRPRRRPADRLAAIGFALPALLVFGYFAWWPIVRGVVMSWQRTNLIDPVTWVGWDNFTYVLGNPLLATAGWNTLWYVALSILFGCPVPLVLAVVISEMRGRRWFQVLSFLPVVVPPVVAILLWKVFYDPSPNGAFNQLLGLVGVGPLSWLNDVDLAMPSLVLEAIWASAGSAVVIYLAAMVSIRTDLYEAAELDGAGILRRVWMVTLPQLRGVVLIMLLLQIIGAAQVFAEPFLFTGGGPNNATTTIMLLIYNYAFVSVDYGAASALSTLLAAALAIFSFLYLWATRKWSSD